MRPSEILLPPPPKGLQFHIEALADPRVEARTGDATISIFDAIRRGDTAPRIAAALRQIGPRPVTVEINSLGGDAFEGIAIFNLLLRHSQPVTAQVLGIAASAASVIAMAATQIQIARNAQIMIHNSNTLAIGTASDLRGFADLLDKVDAAMAATYAARTGNDVGEVRRMMSDEKFMSSDDALQLGFADSIMDREADPKPAALSTHAPGTLRDFEATLRDAGFSRSQATRVAARGWSGLMAQSDIDTDLIAARLDRHARDLARLRRQ